MELHPSRELVASGQRGGRGRRAQAHVRMWSTDTLQTLHVFGMGEFERGVAAVAFSQLVSCLYLHRAHDTVPRNRGGQNRGMSKTPTVTLHYTPLCIVYGYTLVILFHSINLLCYGYLLKKFCII